MNGGGLYNRVKPLEKGIEKYEGKILKKIHCRLRRTPTETTNLSKNFLLGHHLKIANPS